MIPLFIDVHARHSTDQHFMPMKINVQNLRVIREVRDDEYDKREGECVVAFCDGSNFRVIGQPHEIEKQVIDASLGLMKTLRVYL